MIGTVRVRVCNREGRTVHDKTEPLASPLKAMMQILLARLSAADVATVTDTGGVNRTVEQADTAHMMDASGAAGGTTEGIVAGTDGTAVDVTDYALGALIAHGNGAGQLSYGAMSHPADVTTSDPTVTFQASRVLTNNSGGAITILETGMYCTQECTGAVTGVFCLFRDVPTSVQVPDGGAATITYTLTMTE